MLFKMRYHKPRPIVVGLALLILFALAGISYERSVANTAQETRVQIEVLPGEASKFIDASARATVPVAILSSADFDATLVNPISVTLAGAPITKGKNAALARGVLSDVNGDGRIDLIIYVSAYSLRLDAGTTDALLTAATFNGKPVIGSQSVSFKPPVRQQQSRTSVPASGTFTNYEDCGHPVGTPCPITIPRDNPQLPGNANPYPSTIHVSGQGAVTNVNVTIAGYAHTFPDDVDVLLVGPTGVTCLLMSDCGGDNAITSPVSITFDDSAPSSLPDNPPTDPLASGTYRPTRGTSTNGTCPGDGVDNCVPANFPTDTFPGFPPPPPGPYGSTLAVFNGTNPNGAWLLYVIDDSGGDSGDFFNGWTLNITAPTPCPGSIFPGSQSFSAAAGMGSFSVTADAGCNWTATSNAPWVHTTSTGTGSGMVNYTVDANAGSTIRNGTITLGFLTFTVYQGINFNDVPGNNPFYNEIGKLSARSVTLGCGNGNFCPNDPVTREQMAAFIMRAKGEFNPPTPESQRFIDVPPSNTFYAFIDRLATLGITVGCNPPSNTMYCPSSAVTREQMSAFILRGLGEFNPPTPGSQRFMDVPPGNIFYNFIDRMAVLNITLGCTPDHMFYCPGDPVTRAQMAAFLVRAFNL